MTETTLTITVGENGCRVEGPINDKMTCYGMLELARDAIKTFSERQANGDAPPPLIVPPHGLRVT